MTEDNKSPLFNAGAAVYDSFRSLHGPADKIAFVAEISKGQYVLDIACGSGRATMVAAELAGEDGNVTGIDIADRLLEIAREKASGKSFSNIEYRTGDAHDLAFADGSFDTVICASSMYLFSDIPGVIREACRVLKPGGCFVFSVFGKEMFQPVMDVIQNSLCRYDTIEFPEPVFSVTDSPEKCLDFILSAGQHTAEIIVEQLPFKVDSIDDCWRQVASSLFVRPRLAVLDKQEYQRVKQEVQDLLADLIPAGGLIVEVPVIFCKIQKN